MLDMQCTFNHDPTRPNKQEKDDSGILFHDTIHGYDSGVSGHRGRCYGGSFKRQELSTSRRYVVLGENLEIELISKLME